MHVRAPRVVITYTGFPPPPYGRSLVRHSDIHRRTNVSLVVQGTLISFMKCDSQTAAMFASIKVHHHCIVCCGKNSSVRHIGIHQRTTLRFCYKQTEMTRCMVVQDTLISFKMGNGMVFVFNKRGSHV